MLARLSLAFSAEPSVVPHHEALMHHKRKRPKHQRAGCLFCKPHKDERSPKTARSRASRAKLGEPVDLAELEAEELDLLGLRTDDSPGDPPGEAS